MSPHRNRRKIRKHLRDITKRKFNLGGKKLYGVFDSWKLNESNFTECNKIVNLKPVRELR